MTARQDREARERGSCSPATSSTRSQGQVDFMDRAVSPQTGTITVRAALSEPHGPPQARPLREGPPRGEAGRSRPSWSRRRPSRRSWASTTSRWSAQGDVVENRPVKLGVRQGADWLVKSGVKAGERIVVEGLLKAHPGSTVKPAWWSPPRSSPRNPAPDAQGPAGREVGHGPVLHRPPGLRHRRRPRHHLAGTIAGAQPPRRPVPRRHPAHDQRVGLLPGRELRMWWSRPSPSPSSRQVNGVDGMFHMDSQSASDGSYSLNVTFNLGKDPDIATVLVQNRVAARDAGPPRGGEPAGGPGAEAAARCPHALRALLRPRGPTTTSGSTTTGTSTWWTRSSASRAWAMCEAFGSDFGMRIWLEPDKMARLGITAGRRDAGRPGAERAGPGGAGGPAPLAQGPGLPVLGERPGAPRGRRRSSRTSSCTPSPTAPSSASSDIAPRRAGGQGLHLHGHAQRHARRRLRREPHPRRQRAGDIDGSSGRSWSTSPSASRPTWTRRSSRTARVFVKESSERGGEDLLRGAPPGARRGLPLPAELARHAHPHAGRARLPRGHLRRVRRCSASPSTRSRSSAWSWPSASWWTTPSWWWRRWSTTWTRDGLDAQGGHPPGHEGRVRARWWPSRWCSRPCSCPWPSWAASPASSTSSSP